MELKQIQCDNLGMSRDLTVSALGKDKSGTTNFAFENYNIRIWANTDNTALAVTNERSTSEELTGQRAFPGIFVGGCKLNKYLVLFIKEPQNQGYSDSIYRLHYNGVSLQSVLLYNGDLNFDLNHPIEAVGYYESEEVQKVYWVDGYNPNRFINISNVLYEINNTSYISRSAKDIVLSDGTLHALCSEDGTVHYYYNTTNGVTKVWSESDVHNALYPSNPSAAVTSISGLPATSLTMTISGVGLYNNKLNPFDFQGSISAIPSATISKDYTKAGLFQAGVIQYFFTYYNKYGVETPIIWNSDLQYISMQDRGAKQDEGVACGFDIEIDTTTLDATNYEYLRIYSCYRSSLNVTVSAKLVTEIPLAGLDVTATPTIVYTDLGTAGETVNAADLKYLGGQNIIAETLDYKQDTLFLGNLKESQSITNTIEPRILGVTPGTSTTEINVYEDTAADTPTKVRICECPGISWVYKLVSNHKPEGVYSYESELNNSQEEIAGFKWREVYRFGIQFMTPTGEWTSAQWIGDKYCDIAPMNIARIPMRVYTGPGQIEEIMGLEADGSVPAKIVVNKPLPRTFADANQVMRAPVDGAIASIVNVPTEVVNPNYQPATPDANGVYQLLNYQGKAGHTVNALFTEDGYYMATAVVDLDAVFPNSIADLKKKYIGYRLLMADMDISNRRIIEQGIINPTMFNYTDRYYNRPFSIPSWIFRPRMSQITNRHYDTLPVQTEENAELQGIVKRQIPGVEVSEDKPNYNAYMLLIAANDGECYAKWKLIYYDSTYRNTTVEDWARGEGIPYSSAEERMLANYAYAATKVSPTASGSAFEVTALYGDAYMVVSSGTIKKAVGNWDRVAGEILATLMNDVKSKKDAQGNELPLVFSSAMLPDGVLLKKIAYGKGDIAYVFSIIALCVATVAAVVATIFTAGGATAAIGAAAAAIASITITEATASALAATLTSLVAGTAIAGMAGVAALAQNKDSFTEVDRLMLSKGFVPVNTSKDITPVGSPAIRTQTAYRIADLLRAYFATEDWEDPRNAWSQQSFIQQALFSPLPALVGDTDTPFYFKSTDRASQWNDGAIGLDYNAYVSGGVLSFTSAEENDLKNKSNVFCVDESIVTLNAPDIEDIANIVDSSDAYDLQLVGMLPIHSVYGAYNLQCTRGLASAAEVLRNRFVVPASVPTTNILGLVNGDFYQDTDISENVLIPQKGTADYNNRRFTKPVVLPSVALYRQWMWNRDTSIGMWMPGIMLQDPLATTDDNPVYIQEAPAQPTVKLFANLRYSFDTLYQDPYSMDIYSPRVCLDDQVMLKMFRYGDDNKYYYENVNTISINNEAYGLVKNRALYPAGNWQNNDGTDAESFIQTAALKDPVQIKFKETPHILIPIKDDEGVSNLLPYTPGESPVSPKSLYGENANKTYLLGTKTASPKNSYLYLHTIADNKTDGTQNEDIIAKHITFADGDWKTLNASETAWLISCFNTQLYSNYENLYAGHTEIFGYISSVSLNDLNNILKRKADESAFLLNSNSVAAYELKLTEISSGRGKITQYSISIRQLFGGVVTTWDAHSGDKVTPYSYLDKKDYIKNGEFNSADAFMGFSVFTLEKKKHFNTKEVGLIAGEIQYLTGKNIWDSTSNTYVLKINYPTNLDEYLTDDYTTWNQDKIDWSSDGYPYLFVGELVKKVFDYETWMGGTSKYALQQLHWNVASPVTQLGDNLFRSWGDTYYQRWDCEKTYPFTEDDKNSVVEVLSGMIESHTNLDGRSDINRGITNLINLRPSNTMFNPVYGQKDNFFSYSILDEKFEKTIFEADIAWSLTKNNMSDVDSWTSFVATNQMSMDGRFGAIRKIINANDTLLVFQDSGLSAIKYNEETALQTSAGLPLQLGNTGKVTGYRIISDVIGCHNKFSINKNSAGLFFTDDYNKAFMQYTQAGLKDVGLDAGFSEWFKENISGSIWTPNSRDAFRTSYDEVTHDLYIITDRSEETKGCLVYNTLLQKFTSFMSYIDTPIITRLKSDGGDSEAFAIHQVVNNGTFVEAWRLYGGNDYNRIFGNPVSYSMEYRINPDPMHDSIFTNYQFTADWMEPVARADEKDVFGAQSRPPYSTSPARNIAATLQRRYTTFDTVEAWDEYQYGIKHMDTGRVGRFPAKSKFRVWRGDIPRDGESITGPKIAMPDRMRNPWMHLKFKKLAESLDDSKMIFHNLNVTYYNQYGRI